ncbi:MAG: RNA polymerase sigma factor [Actinobacteria bacterium]|nr:RNA polymerase sigma factor [Actinomycetota bacterium]
MSRATSTPPSACREDKHGAAPPDHRPLKTAPTDPVDDGIRHFTWLYRIAVNVALARLRRKQVPVADLDVSMEETSPAPATVEPAHVAEQNEFGSFLAARVRELPLEHRAPLVLRDIAGLSNQEVADVLDLSLAAAKSRIHRARLQIREAMVDWERRSGGA